MAVEDERPSRDELEEMAREARRRILKSGITFPDPENDGEPVGRRGSETKQRILDTAVTMFGERGIEACTMRDLATEVGIKAPAIYNHYSSKEDVLAAAMEDILGRFFWGQVATLTEFPVEEWLEQIVTRHVRFQLLHRRQADASDAVLNGPTKKDNLPASVYRRLVRLQRAYADLFCALIWAEMPSVDRSQAMMAGFAMAAMCDRVSGWYDPDGPLSIDEIAARQWLLARQMIKA